MGGGGRPGRGLVGSGSTLRLDQEVDVLELLWIVIIGLVVGALAKFFMPGPDPGGFLVTALLGMGGALVATYLGRFLGLYGPGQGAGFIASIIGAIVILFIYRKVRAK
jgi:uncharacterized membrane protein YeaQ/YmgE (transglycosylase-associated protein family)